MSDLEILRRELLERGDEMISFQQLVERFDSVEKEFGNTPWNLKQIYSNFNILTGENPNKWIPVSDRLPEVKQHVLLSCYGRVIYGRMISENGNSGYPVFEICDSVGEKRPIVLETTIHSEFTTSRIKAWMPLPEVYREEGSGE